MRFSFYCFPVYLSVHNIVCRYTSSGGVALCDKGGGSDRPKFELHNE